MITLVLGPLVFMIRTQHYISDKTQYCISIAVCEKTKESEFLHPKRLYTELKISGEPVKDSLTILLLEHYARGINLSKNDSIGIKVVLSNRIKYKSFVSVLNACLKSGINQWIPCGDTIFIYHQTYGDQYGEQLCQNCGIKSVWGCDILVPETPPPKLTIFQKIVKEKENIKLAIPFIILIFLMGLISLKRNINEG